MTHGHTEWSQEERERAQALLQNDARSITNTTPEYTVPGATCLKWRHALRENTVESIRPLADASEKFVRSTVRKHISGRCSHHPVEVGPPLEYDRDAGVWQRKDGDTNPIGKP